MNKHLYSKVSQNAAGSGQHVRNPVPSVTANQSNGEDRTVTCDSPNGESPEPTVGQLPIDLYAVSNCTAFVALPLHSNDDEGQTPLSSAEKASLADCESRIDRGLATFRDVSEALHTILKERLYRQEYGTFEKYCKERWGFSRKRGYELAKAGETSKELSAIGNSQVPGNEAQMREVSKAKNPQDKAAAIKLAQDEAKDGKLTAKGLKEAVSKIKNGSKSSDGKEVRGEIKPKKRATPQGEPQVVRFREALEWVAQLKEEIQGEVKDEEIMLDLAEKLEMAIQVWADKDRIKNTATN